MALSVQELVKIQDLPTFLRTEHCYNDLQHAMLVILFRHALTALGEDNAKFTNKIIDTITLYLYIHFLNEEEGMGFNATLGLIGREDLSLHSEMHIHFMEFWKNEVLIPFKNHEAAAQQTTDNLAEFYNRLITHIDETDKATYGAEVMSQECVRHELARVSRTNMPMSPFMPGAFETVSILDPQTAALIDTQRLSPMSLQPLGELDLVADVGRVLQGAHGSLRDQFAAHTHGDQNTNQSSGRLYVTA